MQSVRRLASVNGALPDNDLEEPANVANAQNLIPLQGANEENKAVQREGDHKAVQREGDSEVCIVWQGNVAGTLSENLKQPCLGANRALSQGLYCKRGWNHHVGI